MIAMTRIPRVRLVLVVAALMALLVVPMVGAKTLSSPSLHSAGGGWLDAALRWVGDFAGFSPSVHPGRAGRQAPPSQKEVNLQPQNGTCIDPTGGRPRPPFCN
jgi:hypothetical protein